MATEEVTGTEQAMGTAQATGAAGGESSLAGWGALGEGHSSPADHAWQLATLELLAQRRDLLLFGS